MKNKNTRKITIIMIVVIGLISIIRYNPITLLIVELSKTKTHEKMAIQKAQKYMLQKYNVEANVISVTLYNKDTSGTISFNNKDNGWAKVDMWIGDNNFYVIICYYDSCDNSHYESDNYETKYIKLENYS